MNALFLAFAYLRVHWARSLVLVLSTALILSIPVATRMLLSASETALTARAEATPLLLGRRGSALDLTMAALYFTDDRPRPLPMAKVDAIADSGLATPIPLHTAFETSGFRIVGTTLDYFEFREIGVAEGRGLALLGEAVVGAAAAEALGTGPGDTLVSAPRNLFDLDGVYPLEMNVVGVLEPTGSADDEAVFVDLKTAWVIAGIGHGHEDAVSGAGAGQAVAAADIEEFQRITPDNMESFHFHGDTDEFPVSAVIVAPNDTRSATILQGRYLNPDGTAQLVRPAVVVERLVDRIFRIRVVLDAVTAIVAVAALAAVGLAVFLSWRLRAREIETAVRLGARRGMVVRLVAAETVIVLCLASTVAAVATSVLEQGMGASVGWLLSLGT